MRWKVIRRGLRYCARIVLKARLAGMSQAISRGPELGGCQMLVTLALVLQHLKQDLDGLLPAVALSPAAQAFRYFVLERGQA